MTIKIDGQTFQGSNGDTILSIARANEYFIPAICYLERCSATLACKLCMVEADGKRVYACNAKAKDGMEVIAYNEELETERRQLMEVYDINHPLQCGVCDQSGECELQNYTMEMGVAHQEYAIPDTHKPTVEWGLIEYDPGLCIVCERCVTACKDMIGDNALKTVPRGGEVIDEAYKESAPKDVYGVWNKMNKSLIGLSDKDATTLECIQCGECVAVCPVGALVSTDFKYRSNAWELQKVPAACAHCSSACAINYEVKHDSVQSADEKIYRVTNDFHFTSLCGAGRFGFNYANTDQGKDEAKFQAAITAFEKADTVRFDSTITNEEALILQKLKEKRGYKLINPEAKAYQDFLGTFSQSSGKAVYEGSQKAVFDSQYVVAMGSAIMHDLPTLRFAINNTLLTNKGSKALYFHTLDDAKMSGLGKKNMSALTYKPLQEELLMMTMVDAWVPEDKLPENLKSYLASKKETKTEHIEETVKEKVTDESGEEKEVEKKVTKEIQVTENKLLTELGLAQGLSDSLKPGAQPILLVGSDLYAHPRAGNMAKLLGLIEQHTDFQVVLIPPSTNALGVALICDLDETPGSYTIGYNQPGDFVLSSFGDGDLSIPAPNQQEGTFTNIDKRVVPTNAALHFDGYELNDITNALGIPKTHTIDYTQELPESKGFQKVSFDSLPNHFQEDGTENRGYCLSVVNVSSSETAIEEVADISEMNGTVLYACNPIMQFNRWTGSDRLIGEAPVILADVQAMEKLGYQDGEKVEVEVNGEKAAFQLKADKNLKGEVLMVSTFQGEGVRLFESGYRYAAATLQKAQS